MHRHARPQLDRWPQRLLLWCLLLALPLEGMSAARAQMLGASHFHREAAVAASAMDGWQDIRRMPHAAQEARPVHTHALFQRHHHSVDDATVVALDAEGGNALSGEASTITASAIWLAFSPSDGLSALLPDLARSLWPRLASRPIQSCDAKRLERPPQA